MPNPKTIYQIKVTLVGSKPTIWRRILVADTTTLGQLHTILQITMGWTNSHLHLFKVGEQIYSDQEYDEDIEFGTNSEKRYRLNQIAPEGGFRFRYENDFVTVGSILCRWRRSCQPKRENITRSAWPENAPARPKTRVVAGVIKNYLVLLPIQAIRKTVSISIGSVANSIPKNLTRIR